jgi:hypothetical protein
LILIDFFHFILYLSEIFPIHFARFRFSLLSAVQVSIPQQSRVWIFSSPVFVFAVDSCVPLVFCHRRSLGRYAERSTGTGFSHIRFLGQVLPTQIRSLGLGSVPGRLPASESLSRAKASG